MASKRNQFDPGNCSGPARINGKLYTNKDASNGESRNVAGVRRTGSERQAGVAPKPYK